MLSVSSWLVAESMNIRSKKTIIVKKNEMG